ncbi:MAG: hypothetical protein H6759_04130 [Candidatus Nomurabacteria bacterium]|nr:MAG: hypothetical protein H6759_04130 [Candidatus Nomurabacteria bacterium]
MQTSPYHLLPKVLDIIDCLQPKRILDIGCGDGFVGLAIHRYIDQSIRLDGIDKTATKSPLLSSDYQLFTKIDFRSLEAKDLPHYDLVLLLETLQSVNKREGKKLLTQLLQQNNSLLISVDRSQWDKGDFAELSNALFLFDSERTLVFLTKDPEKIKQLRKNRITSKLLRGIGSSKTATRIIKRVTKTKSK